MIIGRFIGIDHFNEYRIPDLTGCVRDATALYSVFVDGIDGLDARLLTNNDASIAAIKEALHDTLDAAAPDDAIILTFATHGTHDHRIVAHDTSLADLDGTTLDLEDLVERFKSTKARFVLVIIDCCFAGAAPARVVTDTPISRSVIDIPGIQGRGKLLLTASRPDEEAYEHPQKRHGLLTAALIDALTQDQASIMTMVDNIVSRVRTDAAGLGVTQNPVATTYIDGGFRLPPLARGDTYRSNFPEYGDKKTTDVNGLLAFGIPDDVVNAWSGDFGNQLHELQLQAVNTYRVLNGRSLFVVAPTSSGKTFIGELGAIKAITEGRKAVFLLPYKALVSEKYEDFSFKYSERLGLRVVRCSGDYADNVVDFITGKYDIAVLTYEMFLGIAVSNPALLNLIGLVVLDEAQFIADAERGIVVELILTLLRMSRMRGIAPQLLLLSAVLGEVRTVANWLELDILLSDKRPVPLEFGVLDRQGFYQYLDGDGREQTAQLLPPQRIRQRRSSPSSQDVLVPLAQQLTSNDNERIIVFRSRRGETEGCSRYLAAELRLPPASDAIAALPTEDPSTSSPQLRAAMEGGVAFHDSNLNAAERAVVETFFRQRDGNIRVITATSGLSAGINTPASTVVIVETARPMQGNPPMSVGFVRNMAGRAGRFGFQETGRAIILASSSIEREQLFRRYVVAPNDRITSSFTEGGSATWVLRLLRQVGRISRSEVPALLLNTFGGYLITLNNPETGGRISAQVNDLLGRMLANGLIDENEEGVALTPLGMACGASSLSFESCIRVVEMSRSLVGRRLTPFDLIVMLQALQEGDTYVPTQRKGVAEGRWQTPFIGRFGQHTHGIITRGAQDNFAVWARMKRCLIALDWMNGTPIEQIERAYSVSPYYSVQAGDVRSIVEAMRFRLRSIQEIVFIALPESSPDQDDFERVLLRLEFGVPTDALFLLSLSPRLTRMEMVAVLQAGIANEEHFYGLTVEQAQIQLGETIATKLREYWKAQPTPEKGGAGGLNP